MLCCGIPTDIWNWPWNGGNAADMLGLRAGQVVDYEVVA